MGQANWSAAVALVQATANVPGLIFVLDHLFAAPIATPSLAAQWLSAMSVLASYDNVFVKVSGAPSEAGPGWTPSEVAPYVTAALDIFGFVPGGRRVLTDLTSTVNLGLTITMPSLASPFDADGGSVLCANCVRKYLKNWVLTLVSCRYDRSFFGGNWFFDIASSEVRLVLIFDPIGKRGPWDLFLSITNFRDVFLVFPPGWRVQGSGTVADSGAASYGAWTNALVSITANATDAERKMLFSSTASLAYRFSL